MGKQERDYLQGTWGKTTWGETASCTCWGQAAKSAEQNLGVLLNQNLPVETAVTRDPEGQQGGEGGDPSLLLSTAGASPQIFTWTPSARETESKQQRIS